MATYTEKKRYKTEVLDPDKTIQLRIRHSVEKDGVEIGSEFERKSFEPGSLNNSNAYVKTDVSNQPDDVKNIAAAIWTDAVHTAWEAKVRARPTPGS